ncbi:MAG: phosphoglycerate kinase [Candidatus Actinomarina sp.]|nr:phosphoglycerate kinase [Candidatus Actinomarina sp.]
MSSRPQLGNTLIRADLNVPIHKKVVKDNFRIIKAIEYLEDLRKISKSVTFLSHLGRPDGINLDYSLKPVAEEMSLLLNEEVLFINSLHGPEVKNHLDENPGKVFLLENLRFHNEETENNLNFAKKVTENFDSFILDAFGAAHRNHASIVSFGNFLDAYQGKLMTNEVNNLELLTNSPKKPFSVILGGAKISDKLQLINNLLPIVDNLLIGGGMCFTFLKALGNNIGKSLYEEDYLQKAKELLDSDNGKKIHLPSDFGVTKSIDSGIRLDKEISEFSDDDIGVDISERTVKEFESILVTSNTVFWNGPMGIFEIDNFKLGTQSITEIVSNLDAYTVVGGGDSVSAIRIFSDLSKFNHISTGGGASLKYLQGNELPGVNIYKPLIL